MGDSRRISMISSSLTGSSSKSSSSSISMEVPPLKQFPEKNLGPGRRGWPPAGFPVAWDRRRAAGFGDATLCDSLHPPADWKVSRFLRHFPPKACSFPRKTVIVTGPTRGAFVAGCCTGAHRASPSIVDQVVPAASSGNKGSSAADLLPAKTDRWPLNAVPP